MYVSYEAYTQSAFVADAPERLSEAAYARLSTIADTIIDDWTYGRVGRAVESGEELPSSVTNLYCAIMANASALVESAKDSTGAELSSFSNGVDSYGFDTSNGIADRLESSLQWLIAALPLRWTSACVFPYERRRGCWHEG